MNKKYKFINELYKDVIFNVCDYYENSNNIIHDARNKIKVIEFKNKKYVLKSFKKPNFFNRIVYSFFRTTKAKKSYDYSLKIKKFVPKALGFIEFYDNSLINDSYFISELFDYTFTIREPLVENGFINKNEIFKAFAKFTFELHENGILHHDYSPGNILIKEEKKVYTFKIVDINRMSFKPILNNERMQNFSKLWAKDDDLKIIIKEYCKIASLNYKEYVDIALEHSNKHKNRINAKKRRRGQKVVD